MANSSGLPGHMIPPGPGGHHPVLGHPGLHTPPFPPISSPAGGGKGGSSYPGGEYLSFYLSFFLKINQYIHEKQKLIYDFL